MKTMRPTKNLTEEEYLKRDDALRRKAMRSHYHHQKEQDAILTQRLDLLVARCRANGRGIK